MAEQIIIGSLALTYEKLAADVQAVNQILAGIGKDAKTNADAIASQYTSMTQQIAKAAKDVAKAQQEMSKPQKTDEEKFLAEKLKEASRAYRDLAMAHRE
jgi:hypothetical protein